MEPIIKRYRINVDTSVKGIKTPSVTVEHTGEESDWHDTLAEHDELMAEMDKRYPAVEA